MKTHYLKTLPDYFKQVVSGAKTFEIRKNDRDFKPGDILVLQEYDGYYSGYEYPVIVTYLTDFRNGLKEGYVCMSIRPCPVRFPENA